MPEKATEMKAPVQYDVFTTSQGKCVMVVTATKDEITVVHAAHPAAFATMTSKEILGKAVPVSREAWESHLTENKDTGRVRWVFKTNLKGKILE